MGETTIGKRICALREVKGLTQEQLAERLNVSPQAVSKWENDISCPDISSVPYLAEALDVTTDELLGVKSAEPRVVVVDTNSRAKGDADQKNGKWEGPDKGGLYFAFALILVGVVFLLSKFNVAPFANASFWGIVWPALLLGLGVSWLVSHRSVFGLGVALLGLYFLLYNLGTVTFVLTWSVIWPALLILLGATILLDHFFPNRWWKGDHMGKGKSEYADADGFVRIDSAFTEDTRVYAAQPFRGGDVDMSFGKGSLDLTKVTEFAASAELDIDVSFGEYSLYLPRTVRLITKGDKAFGALEVSGSPLDDAPYTLCLDADVSFGALNVKYM